jgi:hypothetical protein
MTGDNRHDEPSTHWSAQRATLTVEFCSPVAPWCPWTR